MSNREQFDNTVSNTVVNVLGTIIRMMERSIVVFWDGLRNATEHGTPSLLGFVSAFLPLLTPAPVAGMTAISLMHFFGWEPWQAWMMAVALECAGFVLWTTLTELLMRDGWKGTIMQYFFGGAVVVYQAILIIINAVLTAQEGARESYVMVLLLLSLLPALGSISYAYRNYGNVRRLEDERKQEIEHKERERQEKREDKFRRQGIKLTYGKDTEFTGFTEERRELIEKTCPGCGKKFKTTFPKKVTCSDRCRKRISRDKSLNVS